LVCAERGEKKVREEGRKGGREGEVDLGLRPETPAKKTRKKKKEGEREDKLDVHTARLKKEIGKGGKEKKRKKR